MSFRYPAHDILTHVSSMQLYHRWIADLFSSYWGSSILEIGSGIGSLSKLLPADSFIVLTDKDPAYATHLKQAFSHPSLTWDVQLPPPSKLREYKFDTVFSANVLEHIENDSLALSNIYNLLQPGGKLLLFVPAMQIIFGKLDYHLHHFRRYHKSDLSQKLSAAGFETQLIQYKNLPGFFAWGLISRFLKLDHPVTNSLLSKIYDVISYPFLLLEKHIFNLPFGQNLMVVACRSDKNSRH